MAALPYIQLYVADYLADTMHLTTEEHGAYLLLIMNYWQRGKALDGRNGRLASVARLSNERWKLVEPTLREFFSVDDNEQWFHARIQADLERTSAKLDATRRAGEASAAARKAKKDAGSEQTLNGRSRDVATDAQQNGNHRDKRRLDISLSPDGERVSTDKPVDPCPHDAIVKLWNEATHNTSFPKIRIWNEAERKSLRRRWAEDARRQNLGWWRKFFERVVATPFYRGENDRGWQPDLRWLVEARNFARALEGYHENKPAVSA